MDLFSDRLAQKRTSQSIGNLLVATLVTSYYSNSAMTAFFRVYQIEKDSVVWSHGLTKGLRVTFVYGKYYNLCAILFVTLVKE